MHPGVAVGSMANCHVLVEPWAGINTAIVGTLKVLVNIVATYG